MMEATEMPEFKLFNKYSYSEVKVDDISLAPYMNFDHQVIMPHTASRAGRRAFGKAQIPIIERFACYLMRNGRNSGKKRMVIRILEDAFLIMHTLTGENPLQLLANAIINSGPREDSARVGRGGAVKRTSVDVSPLRRVNIAMFLLSKGMRQAARKSVKTLAEIISDELIAAAKNSPNSYGVKKRDEIERIAKSNR
ncbi:40S ribosomal protein S5a [Astathelohania contejeani]|uniref:40S ribosomal protein S5a n=1 Tax=Astathelohania contejeani TaxID=164912 RepID=A0ABQ7HZK4_9MICR|nr:40S ribosomal protein S5a [Thelohania contejeani]